MHPSPVSTALTISLALFAFASTACSRQARSARLLAHANQYYEAGDYERAEIEYKNVLQRDRDNIDALVRLGSIYQEQGRDLRALPHLLAARERQPDRVDARSRLGLAYLAAGRPTEARNEAIWVLERQPADAEAPILLADATSTDPAQIADSRQRLNALPGSAERAPVLVARGILELREGRAAEAEVLFKSALAADRRSAEAAGALGVLYWARNDIPAAEASLRQAAESSRPRSPKRLQYAQFKLQTEGADAARTVLRELSRSVPDFLPATMQLAELAAREKNHAEAETLLGTVLARDPEQLDALFLAAKIKLAKGENARAVAELERLLERYPGSTEIAYLLGMAHFANGENGKAIARLSQAVAAKPDMTRAILALAEVRIREREYGPAIAALQKLTKDMPGLTPARTLLADAHRGQGNLEEAAALYAALEKELPRDPQAPFWRGVVLRQQGRHEDATAAFERALALAPSQIAALQQLVDLDLQAKRHAAATERLEREVARDATRAEPWLLLANVKLAAQDLPAAEKALAKAAELQPDSPVAHMMLAHAYLQSNQPDKAMAALQAASSRSSQHAGVPLLMAGLHEQRGEHAAARDAYEKGLALDPRNAAALNNLACLYADHFGKLDRAFELAQTAREILPNSPETADTLGWILHRRGQYARALPLLEQAAAALPKNGDVLYHLGLTHYMLGAEEPARQAFQRALATPGVFASKDSAQEYLSVLELEPTAAAAALEKVLARRKDDPVALIRLASHHERTGAIDKAVAAYETILRTNPNHVDAALSLVSLYEKRNDTARALELAKLTRKQAPSDPRVAHVLGRLAFQGGEHTWATGLLEESARQQPADPELLCDLAEALYSTGRVAAAEEAMRGALAAGTSFGRSARAQQFLDLTSLAADPTKTPPAAAKIEQALQAHPDDVPALMAMAALSEQRADLPAARKYYEAALKRYPEFGPAQRRLAVLYTANPADNQKAYELAAKARKSFPNDAELAKAYGVAVLRQGNYARASSLLQESARQRSADGELMYYLGVAQAHLQRQADAKRALERALELGINDELAADARQTLAQMR